MTTNTPEPVVFWDGRERICSQKEKDWDARTGGTQSFPCDIPLYGPDILAALQAERERAEKLENEATADAWILSDLVSKLTEAEAELAALEVKTWNAAIEAAADGFELDDGHYYDQVRESILRLKK